MLRHFPDHADPPATRRVLHLTLTLGVITLVLTALVASGWEPLERLDNEIVSTAVAWTTDRPHLQDPLDRIGVTSGKRILWPLAAAVAGLLWLAGRHDEGLLIGSAVAATTVVTGGMKRLLTRDRPEWYVPEDPLVTTSFPSGHVSLWVGFVVALLLVLPLLRATTSPVASRVAALPLLLLVAVISAQRVLQGRHFPSDVVAGALVGAGCALACWVVLTIVTTRRSALPGSPSGDVNPAWDPPTPAGG